MGRTVLLVVGIAVAVGFAIYLQPQAPQFSAGFWRLDGALDPMIILAAIGLGALRSGGRTGWIAAALAVATCVAAAYLTTRGLRLPEPRLATMLSLLLVGLIGAASGKYLVWLAPVAALAGAWIGHNAGGVSDSMALLGLGVGAATLVAIGALISDLAERWDGAAPRLLAAGVAGVGAYLLVSAYLI